jgi:hypothetical protein
MIFPPSFPVRCADLPPGDGGFLIY